MGSEMCIRDSIKSIGTFALDVAGKNGNELAQKVVDPIPVRCT